MPSDPAIFTACIQLIASEISISVYSPSNALLSFYDVLGILRLFRNCVCLSSQGVPSEVYRFWLQETYFDCRNLILFITCLTFVILFKPLQFK